MPSFSEKSLTWAELPFETIDAQFLRKGVELPFETVDVNFSERSLPFGRSM